MIPALPLNSTHWPFRRTPRKPEYLQEFIYYLYTFTVLHLSHSHKIYLTKSTCSSSPNCIIIAAMIPAPSHHSLHSSHLHKHTRRALGSVSWYRVPLTPLTTRSQCREKPLGEIRPQTQTSPRTSPPPSASCPDDISPQPCPRRSPSVSLQLRDRGASRCHHSLHPLLSAPAPNAKRHGLRIRALNMCPHGLRLGSWLLGHASESIPFTVALLARC